MPHEVDHAPTSKRIASARQSPAGETSPPLERKKQDGNPPAETKPRSQAWRRRCSMVGTLGRRDGAAVDDVLRAGDGGGARRDEKGDEVGYFLWPGRAPDRNAAE